MIRERPITCGLSGLFYSQTRPMSCIYLTSETQSCICVHPFLRNGRFDKIVGTNPLVTTVSTVKACGLHILTHHLPPVECKLTVCLAGCVNPASVDRAFVRLPSSSANGYYSHPIAHTPSPNGTAFFTLSDVSRLGT